MVSFCSIDPGVETGVTRWVYDPHGHLPAERVQAVQFKGGLDAFLKWWDITDMAASFLIVEKFTPDGRATKIDEFEPIRIEGAIKTLWGDDDSIVWQTNQALAHVKEPRVRDAGYWVTPREVGRPDANDANSSVKHALYWLKQNHEPTRLHVWGDF